MRMESEEMRMEGREMRMEKWEIRMGGYLNCVEVFVFYHAYLSLRGV